jgi:hypothetical protein
MTSDINNIAEDCRNNSVLLIAGRNAYLDKLNSKSIYSKAEGTCKIKFHLENNFDFAKLFANHYLKRQYYEFFEKCLNFEISENKSLNLFIEIPFSLYLSFDENFIIRHLFNQTEYQFEDWQLSKNATIKQFIKDFKYSETPKIITFPVISDSQNKSYPIVTNHDLVEIAGTIAGNADSVEDLFKEVDKLKTIIIMGFEIDNDFNHLMKLIYNRFIFGGYSTIESDFFSDMINQKRNDLVKQSYNSSIEEMRDAVCYEFYFYDRKIVFVPANKSILFIERLHEVCKNMKIDRLSKIKNKSLVDKEILRLIAEDEVGTAIDFAISKVRSIELKNQLIQFSGRLKQIENDNRKGILYYDDFTIQKNKIRNDLLQAITN